MPRVFMPPWSAVGADGGGDGLDSCMRSQFSMGAGSPKTGDPAQAWSERHQWLPFHRSRQTPIVMRIPAFLSALAMMCSLAAQTPIWHRHFVANLWDMQLTLGAGTTFYAHGDYSGAAQLDATNSLQPNAGEIFIARYNSNGQILWTRSAGGTCQYNGATASTGHFDSASDRLYVSGQISCFANYFGDQYVNGPGGIGNSWRYIACYNGDGDCIWARNMEGTDLGIPVPLTDGNGVLHAFNNSYGTGAYVGGVQVPSHSAYVVKYGSDGTQISCTTILNNGGIGIPAWYDQDTWSLCGTLNNSSTLFGQLLPITSPQGEGFVALADTNGTVNWVTKFPASVQSGVTYTFRKAQNRITAIGWFEGALLLPSGTLEFPGESMNNFIASLEPDGTIEWIIPIRRRSPVFSIQAAIDDIGNTYLYSTFQDSIDIGNFRAFAIAPITGFVAKLSPQGECLSFWSLTPLEQNFASGSALPTSHGLYLSAAFDSTVTLGNTVIEHSGNMGPDIFLARFDSLSGFTNVPTAMAPEGGGLVIYANPTEGRCTVELPKGIAPGSVLRLVVRDAQGQLVQEEPFIVSASGTVQLDISAQARGVYHVELLDERRRYTGKVVFE